jgi:hypothetical protein
VLYYSGHGWRNEDQHPPAYYLLPYDVRATALAASALRAEDFAAAVRGLAPRRLLVVLDCCHAAGMGVKGPTAGDFASAAISPALLMGGEKGVAAGAKGPETLAQGAGRAVLSSSQGHQPSYMRRDGRMSIFTYHLIEALTGHAGPAAGATEVLVSDVMSHVWRRVPASARADAGADQQPDYQISGNFPVALLLGGQGVGKGAAPPDPLAPLPLAGTTITQTLTGRGVQAAGPVATGGSAISTGSGVAFVGSGNTVITGKVGGDVRVGSQMADSDAGPAEFLALLAQIHQRLTALASPTDRAEAAAELAGAAELAQRVAPPGGRIVRTLADVAEIVAGDRGTVALVARAIQLAQGLWR